MQERKENGRFKPGIRYSQPTEFKPGQHWRTKKPWWGKKWLLHQYVDLGLSASDIAKPFSVTENAIFFWLSKHGIPRRTISEARGVKKWTTPSGPANPMYGRRGQKHPNFQGGNTPYRQKTYSRSEWREFMRQVWARDRHCRLCGSKVRCEVHHIDPIRNTPLLIQDIGNVILLCETCHDKLKGKELWWRKRLFKLIERG